MRLVYVSVILSLILLLFYSILFKVLLILVFSFAGAILATYVNRDKLRQVAASTNRASSRILWISQQDSSPEVEADRANVDTDLETDKDANYFRSQLLISTNVDAVLEEISDYVLRDFFFQWYTPLVPNDDYCIDVKLKNEVWGVISRLLTRMQNFDDVSFITKDLVCALLKHFSKIRVSLQNKTEFHLFPFLENKESEIEFLRKVAGIILVSLLPHEYSKTKPVFHILREILAIQILYNAIDYISEPDFINEKLSAYLKNHAVEMEKVRKTYSYAETFEDFIEIINKCNSVEELKRIRYYVITEIMQSTALHNLKRQRNPEGFAEEKQFTQTSTKGSLLMNRDLKRYINQLRFAKRLCGRRINAMLAVTDQQRSENRSHLPQPKGKKVLGFTVIMHSDICRNFFRRFLQNSFIGGSTPRVRCAKHLVLFWESVQEMKNQERVKQYQIANELLNHSYFLSSINNHVKLPKRIVQSMQQFVKGNKGPEVYFKTQSVVYDILEQSYYPLFIVSKEYDEMIAEYNDYEKSKGVLSVSEKDPSTSDIAHSSISLTVETSAIEEHTKEATAKLKTLQQKVLDKTQALQGAKSVSEHSSSVNNAKLIFGLEKDIQDLDEEIHQVSTFIRWSQQWLRHLTQWKAELHNIQFEPGENDVSPVAIVIIHLVQLPMDLAVSGGWIIARPINEFITLKHKLKRIKPELKKIEILRLKNVSQDNLTLINKAKDSLQQMLDMIFADENCLKTEEMFLFCSPSSEDLRQPLAQRNKSQLSKLNLPFAQFFGIPKSPPVGPMAKPLVENTEDEISDLAFNLDELENKDNGDNIAEPLYNLVSEIFELSGTVGLLRKSLIIIVQITFGQTINKQLRETISWFSSESMIYYYLVQFLDSFWPNGVLSQEWPEKTKEQKLKTAEAAKLSLLEHHPEIFDKLFGSQRARNGLLKVFEYLQNKNLNKQLIYEWLECFMFEFIPELTPKSSTAVQQEALSKQ